MLDNIVYLPEFDASIMASPDDIWIQNKIEMQIGGTGINVSLASQEIGFSPTCVIGKIGVNSISGLYDNNGSLVISQLSTRKLNYYFANDRNNYTGTSIVIYLRGNHRIMIPDRGANATFSSADVSDEMRTTIRESDILFISGYALLTANSALAIVELMQEARDHGRFVVLDVVPHRLYTILNKEEFRDYTKYVNLIISVVSTIKHYLNGSLDFINESRYDAVLQELMESHFGVFLSPNPDTLIISDRTGFLQEISTNYSNASIENRRGYLDKLMLMHLRSAFERYKSFSNNQIQSPQL